MGKGAGTEDNVAGEVRALVADLLPVLAPHAMLDTDTGLLVLPVGTAHADISLDAITATCAQLPSHAWPQQVWLVRPAQKGQPPARAVVDFKKMQETGDMSQNYVLHEGDIITLPDSPLSSFNFKATQVLGPVSGATQVGGSVTPGVVR